MQNTELSRLLSVHDENVKSIDKNILENLKFYLEKKDIHLLFNYVKYVNELTRNRFNSDTTILVRDVCWNTDAYIHAGFIKKKLLTVDYEGWTKDVNLLMETKNYIN